MRLCDCPARSSVRVVDVDVEAAARLRVADLGLRPGAVLHVTHHAPFGGVVVAAGGARIAVDAATAHHVAVESLRR